MAENERKRGFPVLGIAYALLALSAVVGLSTLFGFVGPKSGFQWELASIFGTALGTRFSRLRRGSGYALAMSAG